MAMKHLGDTVDLHGGGRDLVFPHHENELVQSECATGQPFCRHWNENGLVNLGGQKMSKSTGVVFNVEDLKKEVEPVALRLYLLSTHYRSPIEYARERLGEAAAKLDRLRNFLQAATHAVGEGAAPALAAAAPDGDTLEGVDRTLHETLVRCEREFHEALDDDFNTAGALGKVYELVRESNVYLSAGQGSPHFRALLADACRRTLAMTGLLGIDPGAAAGAPGDVPPEVVALVDQREAARQARNWAEADRLRDALREAGWAVEDRPDGPLVKSLDSIAG
jgi:cysteinyl-tRNA synthetase